MSSNKANTIKVDTYCPVFPGFYNSVFSFDSMAGDIEYTLFNDPDAVDKGLLEFITSDLVYDNINNEDYENRIGELCCEFIAEKCNEILPGIVKGIEFENIQSPKQYNFSTDSINCIIELDFNLLLKTFIKHPQAAEYLKDTYTSRDGFISHYPNSLSGWITEAFDGQDHTTGAMLEFLLTADDGDDFQDINNILRDLLEGISENIYCSEYINYDNILQAINEKYTYNEDLTEFSQLEGFTPIIGGNRFMQLLTGIGFLETDAEDIPESEFFAPDGMLDTLPDGFGFNKGLFN